MRVAFAGTPTFAATILESLIHSRHEVGLVISQPDTGRGRGRKVSPSPVSALAKVEGLNLLQPDRIGEAAGELASYDALVVAAYGQILRADTLYATTHGAWNVHASLLPAYRGAAPMERAIMNGETETGVSIMRMNEGLDTGPVALQKKCSVSKNMNSGELTEALARLGAEALLEALDYVENGSVKTVEQDEQKATYAPKITSQEREISWDLPVKKIHDKVRALSPIIGARTFHTDFEGPIKILRSHVPDKQKNLTAQPRKPGALIGVDDRILVECAEGVLRIDELQAPGKKPLRAEEFLRGKSMTGSFYSPEAG